MAEIKFKGPGRQTVKVMVEMEYCGSLPLDQRRIDGMAEALVKKAREVEETFRFVRYVGEPEC